MRLLQSGILAFVMAGCAPGETANPVQLVTVSRDGAPALAVFSEPDIRISALSPPMLELGNAGPIRIERGGWTADSAYYAEPPWTPRGALAGSGTLHVSFCRSHEAFCTVHSYPVTLK